MKFFDFMEKCLDLLTLTKRTQDVVNSVSTQVQTVHNTLKGVEGLVAGAQHALDGLVHNLPLRMDELNYQVLIVVYHLQVQLVRVSNCLSILLTFTAAFFARLWWGLMKDDVIRWLGAAAWHELSSYFTVTVTLAVIHIATFVLQSNLTHGPTTEWALQQHGGQHGAVLQPDNNSVPPGSRTTIGKIYQLASYGEPQFNCIGSGTERLQGYSRFTFSFEFAIEHQCYPQCACAAGALWFSIGSAARPAQFVSELDTSAVRVVLGTCPDCPDCHNRVTLAGPDTEHGARCQGPQSEPLSFIGTGWHNLRIEYIRGDAGANNIWRVQYDGKPIMAAWEQPHSAAWLVKANATWLLGASTTSRSTASVFVRHIHIAARN